MRVAFSARSPKLAEILLYGMVSLKILSGPTYAKINTYSKINVRRAREREQTMQTFENAFSLILGDIIQIYVQRRPGFSRNEVMNC